MMMEHSRIRIGQNEAQSLVLRLIEISGYNSFNGVEVVRDLRAHPELWEAVWYGPNETFPLLALRDLPHGIYHASVIWVLTDTQRVADMERVINTWGADELVQFTGEKAYKLMGTISAANPDAVVLRVWWD